MAGAGLRGHGLKVRIQRLAADPELKRKGRLLGTTGDALAQFLHTLRGQGWLAARVTPFSLRNGNAFTLALTNQRTLELSDGIVSRRYAFGILFTLAGSVFSF